MQLKERLSKDVEDLRKVETDLRQAINIWRALHADICEEVKFMWNLMTPEQQEKVKAWHRERLHKDRDG